MNLVKNIFQDFDTPEEGEIFDVFLKHQNVVFERIRSSSNLEDKLMVQDHDEWVVVLEGGAHLEVKGVKSVLEKGDCLFIPREEPHRVLSAEEGTLWLAVHIYN